MFWYQNVRECVLSKNLLYDTLSPLSILKNPRWRPRWPPYILNWILTLYMTDQNTNNLQKSQASTILFNFIVSASSFTQYCIQKIFFSLFLKTKNTIETGILMIINFKMHFVWKSLLYKRIVIYKFYFYLKHLFMQKNWFEHLD